MAHLRAPPTESVAASMWPGGLRPMKPPRAKLHWQSLAGAILLPLLLAAVPAASRAQSSGFVAPPRTISDITLVLDQEKPDPAAIERLRAAANTLPPADDDPAKLTRFYYRRAQARSALGQLREASDDAELAIKYRGEDGSEALFFIKLLLVVNYHTVNLADPERGLALLAELARIYDRPQTQRNLFNVYRHTTSQLVAIGDLTRAEAVLAKIIALHAKVRDLPENELYTSSFVADVESCRALYLAARGQYHEAELAAAKAEIARRDSLAKSVAWPNQPARANFELAVDSQIVNLSEFKMRQGRMAEAEIDMRRALLSRLKAVGKYHPTTAAFLGKFAVLLANQGRYNEAEKLLRTASEIFQTLGFAENSPAYVRNQVGLAAALYALDRPAEALALYRAVDKAIEGWEPARKEKLLSQPARILAMYEAGDLAAGIAQARAQVERERQRVGENHADFALAKGVLALGLIQAGQEADALRELEPAIPLLVSALRRDDEDADAIEGRREKQIRSIVESYIGLLAHSPAASSNAVAVDSFGLADAIRGQSVQAALAASSARIVARDPALADLARKEQNLRKQIGAQIGMLNNLLAQPPLQRDDKLAKALGDQIEELRAGHAKMIGEIGQRFPEYVELLYPKAPTLDEIRGVLRGDEALVSFYFGRKQSFVWAIPKVGPVAFAAIPTTAAEIEKTVNKLRAALEPNASTVEEIPPFDLALAHGLYNLLLKPVEQGWTPAKRLTVIVNGAMGLLPLSLLPTAAADPKAGSGPLFSEYRDVHWLARTHSVTVVPSAAAFRTLRRLPPGPATRESFIAFGDPYFSAEQATEAETPPSSAPISTAALRGVPLKRRAAPQTQSVDSAELALLPRLPDTADELKLVAQALRVNSSKSLFLGKAANENVVTTTDLSRYRVVAFATHGLVSGDLNGLTQPALALSAPDVAGVPGDGLLTLEEILALKLDADWVVLSACNTGVGASAGADAASGLARAFFYAGTRTVLVTNWSVHSASARELVADLFRRQSAAPDKSRDEALRQAMMAMLDQSGFTDQSGKMLFSYAHPLFWAPYTIIGDGGGAP
ncbi:MAG: CHAT domain-containing protein [Reyranellaceae bacterium]